ncbi:pyrroloquinoline quinone precursor peptide PqqA [Xanthomonas melonis]|uniref:pyrroloquinoline quinone precursor peptide PqqA n=1 Tax=Xanthomonas melonis TaxID=56456 RepID=UPI001E2A7ACC|nr:pyrroloquinoline quinone precursor peptide PqqA [Xanthomonas melonis]
MRETSRTSSTTTRSASAHFLRAFYNSPKSPAYAPSTPSRHPAALASPTNDRGEPMKTWKKPVVREVNCGAEINCYVSGEF